MIAPKVQDKIQKKDKGFSKETLKGAALQPSASAEASGLKRPRGRPPKAQKAEGRAERREEKALKDEQGAAVVEAVKVSPILSPSMELELREAWTHLTSEEKKWLIRRPNYTTDAECSRALGKVEGSVRQWKVKKRDFMAAYNIILESYTNLTRLIATLEAENTLPSAASELRDLIDRPWDGLSNEMLRAKSAQLIALLKGRGIYTDVSKHVNLNLEWEDIELD